ncbi:MAG: nitroreductase family deazaflavin-dependent oxidoreductase [Anaerolineales bacterium]|nr:nitroreductase family deazaflavin-dependent oxidoreductase [Anaerolineales bacterium]
MNAFEKPPGGFLKFFLKTPVWIYKIGFGGWERLFGAEWMLLTTIGRKSGKPRQTMVDILEHDKDADIYYIEAAYGARADWYKNIQANPLFEAQVGRRKFHARATELVPDNAADMLVEFYRRKPVYTRSVMALVGMKFEGEDELRKIARELTLLAVKPE